jgi:hypothetical protein
LRLVAGAAVVLVLATAAAASAADCRSASPSPPASRALPRSFRPVARLIAEERPTAAIRERWVTLASKNLKGAAAGKTLEMLSLIFRESVKDVNEDKKYYVRKLQEENKAAEKASQELKALGAENAAQEGKRRELETRLAAAQRGAAESRGVLDGLDAREGRVKQRQPELARTLCEAVVKPPPKR